MGEYKKCASCKYNTKEKSELPCCACIDFGIDFYKPMTNADRIRNMSDEELAEWLHNMCDFDDDGEPCKSIYDLDKQREIVIYDSYGDLLQWLQAEVKEGAEDESK